MLFQSGVDLHNRVPQGEGHPVYRLMRNLALSDQNELRRRRAMEWRQDLLVSADSLGTGLSEGWDVGYTPNVGSLPAVSTSLRQPLALWLPTFGGTQGDNFTRGGRSFAAIMKCASGDLMLTLGDSNTHPTNNNPVYVALPAHPRRPQAVNWRGGLWIACGGGVPLPTASAALGPLFINPATGLVRVGRYMTAQGQNALAAFAGIGVGLGDGYTHNNFYSTGSFNKACLTFRPKCIATYRGRMVVANFPADQYGAQRLNGTLFSDFLAGDKLVSSAFPDVDNIDVPRFAANGTDPWDGGGDISAARSFLIGDDGEEIIGMKELSLQQSGAMNQSALVFFKDRSVWVMTGEPLETADVGEVRGDAVFHKQPIADGCPSFETVCETPWGLIWAGHEDVYFMPNGGGAPIPIGRRIASRLENTPFDMKWRWHAAYHDGHYRLSIMAPGQKQDEPVAMQEEWRLDLRYGPPQGWNQARWFGPQVYCPIVKPGVADSVDCGLYITAKEQRAGMKPELFALALGWSTEFDKHTLVLVGLDGEETHDYACKFSPVQFRDASSAEALSVGERRVIAAEGWTHGREAEVTTGGTSLVGVPPWTNNFGDTVADSGATWTVGGRVAVPANFVSRDVIDGEDAIPTTRGNEVVVMLKSMELPASELNRSVQFRGLEVGAGCRDSMTWALLGFKDDLHQGALLESQPVSGNFILGRTGVGSRVNDPIAPFSKYVDGSQYGNLSVGKHVSFVLAEYPYLTIAPDDRYFSFYFDANNDDAPEALLGATLDLTLTGYGFLHLSQLLDAMVAAMNAALSAASYPGTFSHDLTTNPGTCPVLPTITHSSRKWSPNSYTINFESGQADDSPALWLQLGFDPIGPGVITSGFKATHTAPHSPWQRKIPKLRIANIVAVLRSFRRPPT